MTGHRIKLEHWAIPWGTPGWEQRWDGAPTHSWLVKCSCGESFGSKADHEQAQTLANAHLLVNADGTLPADVAWIARAFLKGDREWSEVYWMFKDAVQVYCPTPEPEPVEASTTTKTPYKEPVCKNCGKQYLGKGKYCDNACRMQAYRRRLKDKKQRLQAGEY